MSLLPGSLFAKNYEIVRPISAGGMGVVYEVVHLGTRRRRALKIMLPHIVSDPRMRERFSLEAVVAADIESEHITEIFDAGIDPETQCPFLVMELLRGEDLGARLKRGERFTAEETLGLMGQMAHALEKTHERGIIHRDLKPDNLFVTRRDDGAARLKILDFGIAKVVSEEATGPQATTSTFGTPFYMAREQITGESALIGPSSDLYSVAHIVFSMLTGAPYFQEEAQANAGNVFAVLLAVGKGAVDPATVRALRRGVELPTSFDPWFARATAIAPADRFLKARAMIDALREVLREPIRIVGPGLVRPTPSAESGGSDPTPGSGGPVAARGVGSQSVPELLHDTGGPQSMTSRVASSAPKRGSRAPMFIGLAVLLGATLGLGAWRLSLRSPSLTTVSAQKSVEPRGAATSEAAENQRTDQHAPTVAPSASSAPSANAATSASAAATASAAVSPVAASPDASAKHPTQAQRPKPVPGSPQPQTGEVWETR